MKIEGPASAEEAAELLRWASEGSRTVRFRGRGTKLGWGRPTPEPDVEIRTERLDGIVEHNAGDLTAVIEAGVTLAQVQEAFGAAGQMLALDPPGPEATIGGIVATADSGPLRHRYGAVRDLLLGITVILSDGTVAKSGGKVIKNVAGYDLAKVFAGSFGTLGMIASVAVRLHPRPAATVTALGSSEDADGLQRAALTLTHEPLEAEAIDVRWADGLGTVLARFGGAAPDPRARRAERLMSQAGLEAHLVEEDGGLWETQRTGQRSPDGLSLRVSGVQTDLANVLRVAAGMGGAVVGRAGLGLSWLTWAAGRAEDLVGTVEDVRRDLAPRHVAVLDAPEAVRVKLDPWPEPPSPALELARRVKQQFDPTNTCNPGAFVGGI